MTLLEKINQAQTDEELEQIITEAIEEKKENAKPVEQLGFLNYGHLNAIHQGFIPFETRIKYENLAIESYNMNTTDFFYEFAKLVKRLNVTTKGNLIFILEGFINKYFGLKGTNSRDDIFQTKAWQTTTTDEEFFEALKRNTLGDLKGHNSAECTERSALAQQILSLFDTESYYCMGCLDQETRQEGHCFNIVKRANDYAVLDYSVPVPAFTEDGKLRAYYPFVGIISKEEFEDFIKNGTIKSFDDYEYINKTTHPTGKKRTYAVGTYEIDKQAIDTENKQIS